MNNTRYCGTVYYAFTGMSGISTAQLLVALAICLGSFFLYKTSSSDPYGLFHLAFNREPGEAPGSNVPKTEWLNQGYWKVRFFPLRVRVRDNDLEVHRIRILFPKPVEVFFVVTTQN